MLQGLRSLGPEGPDDEGTRFEWEPEITAKLLRRGITIDEVPIHYYPRTAAAGKKIRWHDGLIASWTLIKHRFGPIQ